MRKFIVSFLLVIAFGFLGCASRVLPEDSGADVAADAPVIVDGNVTADATDAQPDALPPGMAMVRLIHQPPLPLVASENRLIGVHVWSTGAPISIMKLIYFLFPSHGTHTDPGWGMGNCRLEIDGVSVLPSQAEVYPFAGQDTTVYGFLQAVIVRFHHELIVTNRGSDLTLFCSVTRGSPGSGEALETHFLYGPNPDWPCGTRGMLTVSFPLGVQRVLGPDIYTNLSVLPCDSPLPSPTISGQCTQATYADFIWSPRTASNHSDLDCANGGSDDWISGGASDDPSAIDGYLAGDILRR